MQVYGQLMKSGVMAAAILIACPAGATVDITKNPGCGLKLNTPQERIERNARIAELMFQGYLEAPKINWLYMWPAYDCFAKNGTWYSWLMGVNLNQAKPMIAPAGIVNSSEFYQKELVAQWKVMPDYGTVPGSLVMYPWDGGVQFRYVFEGHTPDGKVHHLWELQTLIINEEGKITEWEFWDDVVGTQDIFKAVVGQNMDEMRASGDNYGVLQDRVIKEGRAIPPKPAGASGK